MLALPENSPSLPENILAPPSAMADDGADMEECRTPRSESQSMARRCPPAPRKPRTAAMPNRRLPEAEYIDIGQEEFYRIFMKSSSCSADASWALPELTIITTTPTAASPAVGAVECHTPDSMECKLASMARSCPPAPRRLRTVAARRKRSLTETELIDVGQKELEPLFRRRDRPAAVEKKRRRVVK